jgi:hypothetical protein
LLADLLKSEGFQWTTVGNPSVVDHHIKTAHSPDNRVDGLSDGRVVRDIQFDSMQGKLLAFCELAEGLCRWGIPFRHVSHPGEDSVSLARQGLHHQTAKATGAARDQKSLLHRSTRFPLHASRRASLLCSVLVPAGRSSVTTNPVYPINSRVYDCRADVVPRRHGVDPLLRRRGLSLQSALVRTPFQRLSR